MFIILPVFSLDSIYQYMFVRKSNKIKMAHRWKVNKTKLVLWKRFEKYLLFVVWVRWMCFSSSWLPQFLSQYDTDKSIQLSTCICTYIREYISRYYIVHVFYPRYGNDLVSQNNFRSDLLAFSRSLTACKERRKDFFVISINMRLDKSSR